MDTGHRAKLKSRTRGTRHFNTEAAYTSASPVTARGVGVPAFLALAIGALACGALALGALAIGRLAVGALAIGRSRIRRLEIEELDVKRLRVNDLQVEGRPMRPTHRTWPTE